MRGYVAMMIRSDDGMDGKVWNGWMIGRQEQKLDRRSVSVLRQGGRNGEDFSTGGRWDRTKSEVGAVPHAMFLAR